ncbi:hypothetical protein HYALB_00009762 [Hymenoscyphus albidus]|uniref:Uncharacterized protein n=1 Tax=Hymenoscyphus albidus TaxID=595503 RepID=A0A9N9LE06_9HELO|nr:hypothetical protein HYALB_00009762 [Hymenoscyphus albidus]
MHFQTIISVFLLASIPLIQAAPLDGSGFFDAHMAARLTIEYEDGGSFDIYAPITGRPFNFTDLTPPPPLSGARRITLTNDKLLDSGSGFLETSGELIPPSDFRLSDAKGPAGLKVEAGNQKLVGRLTCTVLTDIVSSVINSQFCGDDFGQWSISLVGRTPHVLLSVEYHFQIPCGGAPLS